MSGSVAVVIVNYRSAALTLDALAAVAAQRATVPGLTAIVVDGGSGDGSAERLAQGLDDPRYRGWATLLPLALNGGFGWANNQAMLRLMQGESPPDYIHLLNPDTRAEPGAIAALADVLDRRPGCGAVGSLLLDPDGAPSGSAFRFPSLGRELVHGARWGFLGRLFGIAPTLVERSDEGPVGWVTGASVMLRARALKQTGLFDDGFFLYFEEVELMWRLTRAGWDIRHVPDSRVTHVGGAATGVNMSGRSDRRPPLPPYWFASRRRLFTRLWGRSGSAAATLAFLAGRGLSVVRRLVPGGGRSMTVERELRDLCRTGLIARAEDRRGAAVPWNDPPGRPPAWMQARG